MASRSCVSGCGRFLTSSDGHDRCPSCLGFRHAEAALVDESCSHCGNMTMAMLRSRYLLARRVGIPLALPCSSSSGRRTTSAQGQGDLRITVKASPSSTSPRASHSSSTSHRLGFPDEYAGSSDRAEPSISFGAPADDGVSITASGDELGSGEDDSAALPLSGRVALPESDPELTAMLSRAAESVGLHYRRPPSPERSRLDDWFLGAQAERRQPPPVPFFPEVHEEVTRSWKAPFSARNRPSASSVLTTLDGGAAQGYVEVPPVERAIAMQLCPQGAAAWRGNPRLPSRACKFSSALTAKAYGAAGQAASALHAMALLQVHHAKALKQLHEGDADPGVLQELRTATDLALRATKVTARALGQTMSTLVVQERHLWLTLADMRESDKHRFLDSPISQAGLFGEVEDFAQQFSAAQSVSSHPAPAVRCCLHPTAGCSPSVCSSPRAPSCCLHLRSSSATTAACTTAAAWFWPQETGAARLRPCQAREAPGQAASLRRATRSLWILLFRRWWPHHHLLFPFCSVPPLTPGSVVPKTSIKEQFPFPPGPKRARMAVYETSSPHSRPPLSSPVGSRVRSEDATPSPASPAQLWSQVSVTPHTQTPLRDALPFESGPCAPFCCPTVGTSVTPLVPLVRSLGAWLELPRPSRWLLRTIRLGYAIQFARHPPKFRGIRFTSVLSKDAPVLRAEVAVLLAKDAIEPVPPAEMKSGFYSPYFIVPKKGSGLRPILDLRRSEPGPSQAPVQDVDAETHLSMRPSLRLVCSNRPEGRLLPCLDLPSTQTVSPLCVRGASIPVQGPSLRAIPVASCLHQGRRSSPCTIKGSRHSYPQLPRRLAHSGPVSSTVVRTQGYGAQSPQPVGTSGQPGKEQTLPYAEDLFSRHGVGHGQPHSTSLRGACSVNAEMPGVSPAQEGGSTETFSEAPGAYGILSRYHATRIASYETASALASRPGPEMGMAPRHIPGLTHPVLLSHLQPLVGPCVSSGRSAPRASIQACCCFNRRLCHGLGGHVQRARSRGALDRAPAAVAYQLPRVAGSMACSAPLQNAATREACTGPLGQHCDRCVHQPPGRSMLPSHVATRPPSPPLESEASEVASRRSCPRRALPGEWRLHPEVLQLIWRRFGDAQVDMFASPDTSHCQLFFSLSEGTLGTDALACSWPRGLRKYAFPPVSLLAQTLCKVREDEEQVLLVAPYWPNRTWFPELMLLATAPPWQIPLRRDLLSQRRGTLWHPHPDLWNLHVWSLDGTRRF